MVDSGNAVSKLRDLRDSIDNIDSAIVHMLEERFRCTRAVGKLKAQHGPPTRDPGREADQLGRLRHLAANSKLDPDFAEKFLSFVIHEVVRQHERFGAEPAKVHLGMSFALPGLRDRLLRRRSEVATRGWAFVLAMSFQSATSNAPVAIGGGADPYQKQIEHFLGIVLTK